MYNDKSTYLPYNEALFAQALITMSLVVDYDEPAPHGMTDEDCAVLQKMLRNLANMCHNYPHTNLSRWMLEVEAMPTIGLVRVVLHAACYTQCIGLQPRKSVAFELSSVLAKTVRSHLETLGYQSVHLLNRSLPPDARWS